MTTLTIRAHYDGKAFVPDEQVDLPVNQEVLVRVSVAPEGEPLSESEITARKAAGQRFLSRAVRGVRIPDWALSREHLYDDRD